MHNNSIYKTKRTRTKYHQWWAAFREKQSKATVDKRPNFEHLRFLPKPQINGPKSAHQVTTIISPGSCNIAIMINVVNFSTFHTNYYHNVHENKVHSCTI